MRGGAQPLNYWRANAARPKPLKGLRHPSPLSHKYPGNTRTHIETTTHDNPSSFLSPDYFLTTPENSLQPLLPPHPHHFFTAHLPFLDKPRHPETLPHKHAIHTPISEKPARLGQKKCPNILCFPTTNHKQAPKVSSYTVS
jgi:hypothetical protein